MPWLTVSPMESRADFVWLAGLEGSNVSALCRRFEIIRKTGYKWLARHRGSGDLAERSRRPVGSPSRTSDAV